MSALQLICPGRLIMLGSDRAELSVDVRSNDALGRTLAGGGEVMPNQKASPRYRADITAGSLKVTESRRIADLLLHNVNNDGWIDAIVQRNVLQARNPASARRLARLIRAAG
jgi:hypothetical protein